MIEKIKDNIISCALIDKNDKILIALSGGADSCFLFNVLVQLKDEFSLTLGAAHVNHCIRGVEAERDAHFCAELCKKYFIPFHYAKIDIPSIAEEQKVSHEIAGRNERYKFFDQICEEHGYNKVATAHNMNDSVETLLLNIIRGCSINGLCGIKPKNKKVIRPIYNIDRKDIEKFLDDNNISFCSDSTNFKDIYTRNKIRNIIIPQMQKINPDFVSTVFSNISNFKEDNDFILNSAQCIEIMKCDGGYCIMQDEFSKLHVSVKKRVLLNCFAKVSGNIQNVESKHLDILLSPLLNGQSFDMPGNVVVKISKDKMFFLKNNFSFADFRINVKLGKKHFLSSDTYVICDLVPQADFSDKNSVYIDYDRLKNEQIHLRSKKDGDRMKPYGMKQYKKIKEIFNDLKIPSYQRNSIPLLCDGKEIVALVPYRICDNFKINDNTRKILRIQMIKENK